MPRVTIAVMLTPEQCALIEQHYPYLKKSIKHWSKVWSKRLTSEEIHDALTKNLVDCARRYDDSRDAMFRTYFNHNAPFMLIDEWRRKNGRHGQAPAPLFYEEFSSPQSEDVGADSWLENLSFTERHDLDEEHLDYALLREACDSATRGWGNVNCREMMRLYLEGMRMAALGEVYGVSESRISQIIKQVCDRYRLLYDSAMRV